MRQAERLAQRHVHGRIPRPPERIASHARGTGNAVGNSWWNEIGSGSVRKIFAGTRETGIAVVTKSAAKIFRGANGAVVAVGINQAAGSGAAGISYLQVIHRSPREPSVSVEDTSDGPASRNSIDPGVITARDVRGPHSPEFEIVLNVIINKATRSAG